MIDGYINGFSKKDVYDIVSRIDKRIGNHFQIEITGISFFESPTSNNNYKSGGWVKPNHHLVSYRWEGISEYTGEMIKNGTGHCEVYDLVRQIREIKLNELIK